jgi:tetratricopeptide (TPR) repeat protein
MKLLLLFLFIPGFSRADANPPHIKAAAAAYQEAKAALLKKQTAVAVELFSKAIEIEPTFLDAYKDLIDARSASGDRLEAAAAITRFLEIEPAANRYRLQLGQILLAEKQWDRALAQFSFVLKDDPFNADGLLGFAAAAKQLGMEDRASEALAKGRDHYPLDKRFKMPDFSR